MDTRAHLAASLALHRTLAPASENGFCWSPYSVLSALGLATAGAGGATREELAALSPPEGALPVLSGAASPGEAGRGAEPPELAVSNTLWTRDDLPLHDSYRATLGEWPGGGVRHAPFGTDPDGARRAINADVAETTRGLIPELLDPGTVTPETVAALVNALYLRASWSEPFPAGNTVDRDFHAPAGTRRVPTMSTTRQLGYLATRGWQVVTLPAAGEVEAVVLLPDADLAEAEPRLDTDLLAELLGGTRDQRVELRLPRFASTGDAELTGPLGMLGVRTLFTPAADLSGISPASMRVSAAVHRSVLRADEHGFEGAAATAVMMRLTAAVPDAPPVLVYVDRPFLCAVRHRGTGALYFLARITDPS